MPPVRRKRDDILHDIANKRFCAEAYQQMATDATRTTVDREGRPLCKTTGLPLADAIIAFSMRLAELCGWAELIYEAKCESMSVHHRRRPTGADED